MFRAFRLPFDVIFVISLYLILLNEWVLTMNRLHIGVIFYLISIFYVSHF